MSSVRANVEITASSSRFTATLQRVRAETTRWAGAMARGIGGAFGAVNKKLSLGDSARNGMAQFKGDLMSKGFDVLVEGANNVRTFESTLTRFGIAAGKSGSYLDVMRGKIRGVSRDTGIADQEILNGAQTYVDLTGDVDGANNAMTAFARIAQASGSTVSEVATATAAMQASMNLDSTQIEATFSGLISQGKAGAVSLKDFAGELSTLAPQFAAFGTKGPEGMRDLGAALQTIRIGAGSAGEAATQFQAVMGELVKSHKDLKKIGITAFDKDGKLKSFADLVEQISSNEALKDERVMGRIFGRKESQAAVRSLQQHVDKFRELRKAGEDTGAVQRDLATYQESSAGRLDQAFNNLKLTIAEAFTPERIQGFVSAVEGLAAKLGPVVDSIGWIGDKLGSLYGVGQSVRGFFDDANPYNKATASMTVGRNGFDASFGADNSEGARAKRLAKAKEEVAQADAFATARDSIMGAEQNERSTPESIKRAVIASYRATNTNATPEDRAAAAAGSMYLDNAGVKPSEGKEIYAKAMADAMTQAGIPKIVQAIKDGLSSTTIKPEIGKDKVVEAVRTSKSNHTRP